MPLLMMSHACVTVCHAIAPNSSNVASRKTCRLVTTYDKMAASLVESNFEQNQVSMTPCEGYVMQ